VSLPEATNVKLNLDPYEPPAAAQKPTPRPTAANDGDDDA